MRLVSTRGRGVLVSGAPVELAPLSPLLKRPDGRFRWNIGVLDELVPGDVPIAVQAKGGTYSYKDDRDVDDHVFATLEYPNGRTATLSVIQSNGFEASYTQFMGTNGTLIIGKDEALFFTEEGKGRLLSKLRR